MWGIARDGSVWFRSGVSSDLPTGKHRYKQVRKSDYGVKCHNIGPHVLLSIDSVSWESVVQDCP